MKTAHFGLVALLALPTLALAQTQEQPGPEKYRVRAEWRWWKPSLNSQIQKGFGNVAGTLLDLTDDLGVADEDTWEVQGAIKLTNSVKLVGNYVPISYNGQQAAPFNFSYGDQFFFRGEEVVTNLNGHIYGGAVRWEFVRNRSGFLGAVVGARVLLFDSVLLAPDSGKRVIDSETVPVPIVGVSGRAYAGKRLSMEGAFAGITLGDRGHYYELDLSGRIHFSDRFAAQVGYRRISLEGQDDRDFVKMILSGWTFGVELSL